VNSDEIKNWGLGLIGTGGLAVVAKAIWQLMTRRQAVRQMDATATKTQVESLELPFKQATEMMGLLRQDLDRVRQELDAANKRAADLQNLLLVYRKLLIEKGVILPAEV
jgi:hypothetical protein